MREAGPITCVTAAAPLFLIMHELGDNSAPHRQSVRLYEALAAAGVDVEPGLIDGQPDTFSDQSNLDELTGPFRMDVRTRSGTDPREPASIEPACSTLPEHSSRSISVDA